MLEPLHVYADGFLETRLKWRAKEPLTLLELRCYRLQQPLMIPVQQREPYFGCFSWVQLQDEDVFGSSGGSSGAWELTPALSDAEFERHQAVLRDALKRLQAEALRL